MQRYDTYKDSGVKWLGEIPSHWEMLPGLAIFKENKEKNSNLAVNTVLSLSYGKIVVKKDIDEGLVPAEYNTYQIVHPGYIIIRCTDLQNDKVSLRTGLVKDDGIITGAYLGLVTSKKYNSSYIHYFLHAWDITKEIYRHGNGLRQSLSWLDLRRLPILIPPFEEQTAIANYLDTATAKIDTAIAQQQKMIDLLNERKQIIINRAVTKGLNPNAKMKDSGVEWIGEVPEGWEVRKTLFCLSMPITDGPHETPQLYEDGIPFVSAEAVSCGNGRIDFDHIRGYISKEFYDECCKKYIPRLHDIYMIKSGATTGKVALVDTNRIFTIWSPLAVFRCDENVMCHDYMFYMLQSDLYQLQVQLGWSYGTQQNIGMRTLEKLKVPVPPINEQIEIANYIIEKSKPIDDAISIANRQISLLQERKQIIINEVVTGKVKVG